MKPKLRIKGDTYRPTVTVCKEKNGTPTRVAFNGNEYALIHPDYINGNKNKVQQEEQPMQKNTVTQEQVDNIFYSSTLDYSTHFDKCTVLVCQLPNGFIIVESSACVDVANYDENMGADICNERVKNKIWELEGYKLQSKIYDNRTK